MSPDESLLQLIGEIYDCTLNAEAWNTVLPRIGSFVGGSAGGFFVHNSSRRNLNVVYQFATDAEYRRLYVEKYMALDPIGGTYFVLDVGEVFSTSTIMPHAEFLRSRFYRELIQPRGWIDNICVYLDKGPDSHAGFALFRSEREGLADEEARARLRLLVPHLRRAVLIGKAIEFKTAEAATFADALDGLSTAMVFVDSSGRITQTNAEGRAMIADRRILHASVGRLVANDPEVNRALQDIFLAADTGDAAIGAGGVAVPLVARDGEHYVAHVLPLSSGARRGMGMKYAAVAVLFVQKAAMATRSPIEAIAKSYKLTPMEVRVLLAIVEIGGAPQVADALGIGEGTVKTHLKRLYQKTGARRQADLVKLLAGYTNPLLG